jgi:hypothetical protein
MIGAIFPNFGGRQPNLGIILSNFIVASLKKYLKPNMNDFRSEIVSAIIS